MREYRFDPDGELPVVRTTLTGPRGKKRVTLVLDTGCVQTQVHHEILDFIGCGPEHAVRRITICGVTGDGDPAYVSALSRLWLFGTPFSELLIAGVDFSKWAAAGIEGLIGWDLIRRFHLDVDGPGGMLRVV